MGFVKCAHGGDTRVRPRPSLGSPVPSLGSPDPQRGVGPLGAPRLCQAGQGPGVVPRERVQKAPVAQEPRAVPVGTGGSSTRGHEKRGGGSAPLGAPLPNATGRYRERRGSPSASSSPACREPPPHTRFGLKKRPCHPSPACPRGKRAVGARREPDGAGIPSPREGNAVPTRRRARIRHERGRRLRGKAASGLGWSTSTKPYPKTPRLRRRGRSAPDKPGPAELDAPAAAESALGCEMWVRRRDREHPAPQRGEVWVWGEIGNNLPRGVARCGYRVR